MKVCAIDRVLLLWDVVAAVLNRFLLWKPWFCVVALFDLGSEDLSDFVSDDNLIELGYFSAKNGHLVWLE